MGMRARLKKSLWHSQWVVANAGDFTDSLIAYHARRAHLLMLVLSDDFWEYRRALMNNSVLRRGVLVGQGPLVRRTLDLPPPRG